MTTSGVKPSHARSLLQDECFNGKELDLLERTIHAVLTLAAIIQTRTSPLPGPRLRAMLARSCLERRSRGF
jgi:hypothetical protein